MKNNLVNVNHCIMIGTKLFKFKNIDKGVDHQFLNLIIIIIISVFLIGFYLDDLFLEMLIFSLMNFGLLYNQIRLYNKYKRINIKVDYSDIIDDKNNPEMAYIPFERAKGLQESMQIFFTDINRPWFLSNEDGSKHKNSDELIQANLDYLEAKKKIENILKND